MSEDGHTNHERRIRELEERINILALSLSRMAGEEGKHYDAPVVRFNQRVLDQARATTWVLNEW